MNKASAESQLGTGICEVEDTEEMFWLSQNDDLQSKILLGTKLLAQYRYGEAADVWRQAALSFPSDVDKSLYLRMGGAYLTTFRFEQAKEAYAGYIEKGGDKKQTFFPLGVWHYLKGEYERAQDCFQKVLPCDDELLIAVIYWHSLAGVQGGLECSLLSKYHKDMEIEDHRAYRKVVAVLAGECTYEEAMASLEDEAGDLDYNITAYGLWVLSRDKGTLADGLMERLLARNSVWPNIAYLAAWHDSKRTKAD